MSGGNYLNGYPSVPCGVSAAIVKAEARGFTPEEIRLIKSREKHEGEARRKRDTDKAYRELEVGT